MFYFACAFFLGKPTPTISVISSSVRLKVFNGSTDLVLREYENIRITLNCSVDQADLDYKWYFRGQPVKGSGSLLNISGSDANSVIGSIQCFATGIGGRGQAYLRIVEGMYKFIILNNKHHQKIILILLLLL